MIDQLRRDFDKKLEALASANDSAGLRELARNQADQTSTVQLNPYPEPEEMAESMANDFADDLFKHYQETARVAGEAAQRIEAAQAVSARTEPA